MKIEIKVGDKWVYVPVRDAEKFPLIKIAHDSGLLGYRALVDSNGKICSLRIDGEEVRYGIDLDTCPIMIPEEITFNWLSIAKAQQIPEGSKITLVDKLIL